MRMLVLLVVLITACAGQQGDDDPVMQSPPATAPSGVPDADRILTGKLGGDATLEGGCAWLDDGEQRWEVLYPEGYAVTFDPLTLTGPEGVVAEEGATVTVTGEPQDDAVTICQVGPVWEATDVRVGG